MQQLNFDIRELREQFIFDGEYIGFYSSNHGHINNTFVLEFEGKYGQINSYLLQEINTNVFKNPDELMENIVGVTSYLKKMIEENGGNSKRETLIVSFTNDGKPYYRDASGRCWRCYNYITDAYTCQSIDSPITFYNAAKAFGKFQRMLADYPIDTLHETIPNFHNTVSRFGDFKASVDNNAAGHAKDVWPEILFALEREKDTGILLNMMNKGKLPVRVTHNDTKLNNVMFDKVTNEGICVVDLDTVMPGLSLYDFGDSIRFGANTADEDEKDVSKVSLNLGLYEQYVKGYLHQAGKSLCKNEIDFLPFSAKLMTYECGIRFLSDYLDGNIYFKTLYPEHNLIRCRTQFALVDDIEKKYDQMFEITQRVYREIVK